MSINYGWNGITTLFIDIYDIFTVRRYTKHGVIMFDAVRNTRTQR